MLLEATPNTLSNARHTSPNGKQPNKNYAVWCSLCARFCCLSYASLFCLTLARVFGSKFAEMPFVSTKEGYRREGNCKRLLKVSSVLSISSLPAGCLHPSMLTRHPVSDIVDSGLVNPIIVPCFCLAAACSAFVSRSRTLEHIQQLLAILHEKLCSEKGSGCFFCSGHVHAGTWI